MALLGCCFSELSAVEKGRLSNPEFSQGPIEMSQPRDPADWERPVGGAEVALQWAASHRPQPTHPSADALAASDRATKHEELPAASRPIMLAGREFIECMGS
jgi:hypothetical protein